MKKILIADKLAPAAIEALESMNASVTCIPDLTAEKIPEVIGDSEILIVRSTKVTKETIDAASSLSLIIRAGAGVNNIVIREKGLRVGLDVYENEPKGGVAEFEDRELAKLATCTPHIGASTEQSTEAIASEVVRVFKAYNETGMPVHVVNIRKKTISKHNLVVRHYNKVGVLAGVLDNLKDQGINVEEMQNTIFNGGTTATCTLKLDDQPSKEIILALNAEEDIIHVELN